MHARLFRICTRTVMLLGLIAVLGFLRERTLYAFNYVIDSNGTYWGIQDDDSPRVDTGSIRATQIAPADRAAPSAPRSTASAASRCWCRRRRRPYLNGELMRGFGLTFDGVNRFDTTQSLDLGGVVISRSVYINTGANWGRWLDTFTNTTKAPLTHQGRIRRSVRHRHDRRQLERHRHHLERRRRGHAGRRVGGVRHAARRARRWSAAPQITVIGSPSPFRGAMTFAGNWLHGHVHHAAVVLRPRAELPGLRQHAHTAARQEPVAAALRRHRPARQRRDVGRRARRGRSHGQQPCRGAGRSATSRRPRSARSPTSTSRR